MRRSSPAPKIILAVILLAVFFVAANILNFDKSIKNFFYGTSLSIIKSFWQIGNNFSGMIAGTGSSNDLKRQIDELKSKNQELLSQIAVLKSAGEENDILRQALNIGLKNGFQLSLAQVVAKDSLQDSVLIDKGAKDGIAKGNPVVTGQKFLVGKIGQVYENFSEVILISSKESSLDAEVFKSVSASTSASTTADQIYGVIKGKGGARANLELIPKDKVISVGDLIVTTALGKTFPAGLSVGTIKNIKNSDTEPFQSAEIEPGFGLQDLNRLFVITNFNSSVK